MYIQIDFEHELPDAAYNLFLQGILLSTFSILALSKYCVKRDPDCNMQATVIFFYKSAIFAYEILQMS